MPDWIWVIYGALFGVILGSFGNYVVYRLPRYLEQEWLLGANEALGSPVAASTLTPVRNLHPTKSSCPSCLKNIAWYDNIPLLSWLALRGKCRHCHASISLRYPILELLGLLIGAGSVLQYGPSLNAVAVGVVGLLLLWLLVIDVTHQILPESLLAPVAAIGLLSAYSGAFVSAQDALLGVVVGFGILAIPALLFRVIRGVHGLGDGDPLLLGALGAFLGPLGVVHALCIGGVLGLINSISTKVGVSSSNSREIAFGPYLIIGAVCVFGFNQF